ncbi:MAG: hypothetical protein ABI837_06925 [Acidobacteriota bacterium]
MKRTFALLVLLMSIGCRSAGTLTLAVTSADPSHTGVPVYLELRDESDRRVAITSAKLAASVPLQLHLRAVLDGRRYQAHWWLDLDGNGAPSSLTGQTEPAFLNAVGGRSDLTLWYPLNSWETSAGAKAEGAPPFCQQNGCGPEHGNACPGQLCVYYAAVGDWLCCIKSPLDMDTPAAPPKH